MIMPTQSAFEPSEANGMNRRGIARPGRDPEAEEIIVVRRRVNI